MVNQIIHRMACSTLVHVVTLPLDIKISNLLTNEIFNFQIKEINAILSASLIFAIQNLFYENLYFINSELIKTSISGLLSTPIYLYHELNKVRNRYSIKPNLFNFKKILLLGTIRQTTIIMSLYHFAFLNNKFVGILGTFLINFYGILMKNHILELSYPIIKITSHNFKRVVFLDILRSSLNDFLTLQLIYII